MSGNNVKGSKIDPFDEILEKIGSRGRFQKIYTVFMVLSLVFSSLIYMNIILALTIPDHWCHVPGRNLTNLTETEWKNLTLPKSTNNRGQISESTCEMYNASYIDLLNNDTKPDNMSCIYGYEYDKTWYEETIATKENWVCDKSLYVTNVFVITRITKVAGSSILGYLGDAYGRQFVYCISVLIIVLGRIMSILTTSSFNLFLVANGLSLLSITGVVQMPFIIGIEVSHEKLRSTMTLFALLGWPVAACMLSMTFWYFQHWRPFMWTTTIPALMLFLFFSFMIESPRWLISKKKFNLAIKQFKEIAKRNGKAFDMTEDELDDKFKNYKVEKVYGVPSLFSSWRLAKNTIITVIVWCSYAITYFTLTLFSVSMGGNPFLNFFLQSLVEVPALFIGQYLSNTLGRRLTNYLFLLISGIGCIPILFIAHDINYENVVIGLSIFIKLTTGINKFAAALQEVEMYPTCLRSSGLSLANILPNLVSCVSPYIVYLGATYDMRVPYYLLAVVYFVVGTLAMFLPETLHEKLPDTLEEARLFGKDQKFWSIPKAKKPIIEDDENENSRLNQEKYTS